MIIKKFGSDIPRPSLDKYSTRDANTYTKVKYITKSKKLLTAVSLHSICTEVPNIQFLGRVDLCSLRDDFQQSQLSNFMHHLTADHNVSHCFCFSTCCLSNLHRV